MKRYFYTEYNVSFSSNRHTKNLQKIIFNKYVYKKHILSDLALLYHRNISWVKKQIFEYELRYKIHNPRTVNIICNATFYRKKKDKLWTLIFIKNFERKHLMK